MDYIKILLIILCISISIYFIYNIFQERFVNCNKDLTVSSKPLYINNGQKIDIDSLNCKKLCIKESNNNNVECITKVELFNALKLPAVRRHAVCIDNSCIGKNDIQKLNGEKPIQFKSADSDKCMNYGILPNTSTSVRKKYLWENGKSGSTKWDMTSGEKHGCIKGSKDSCRKHRNTKRKFIKATKSSNRRYKRANHSDIAAHTLFSKQCNKKDQESYFTLVPGKKVKDINAINEEPINVNVTSNIHKYGTDGGYGGYGVGNYPEHKKHEKLF